MAAIAVVTIAALLFVPALADTYGAQTNAAPDASQSEQADEQTPSKDEVSKSKAIAAAIAIGLAATAGAISMGLAIAKSADSIARQPEAESKIRTTLMLGLVFIETAIIYALIVAILIIFVL